MIESLDIVLKEIYNDDKVSILEYMKIRDLADKKMQVLIDKYGKHNSITAFQKSVDITMQLLQESILLLKSKKPCEQEKLIIQEALEAQVKYLQVGWQLVNNLF